MGALSNLGRTPSNSGSEHLEHVDTQKYQGQPNRLGFQIRVDAMNVFNHVILFGSAERISVGRDPRDSQ